MRERIRIVREVVRDPSLLRIQLAYFGFNMAEYATWLAMLVYAYDRGGASLAGVVAVAMLIPAAMVAPFGAFAGDRWRRDRVLFVGYFIQALALGAAAIALSSNLPSIITYAVLAIAASAVTFTRPTQAALLPGITRTAEDLTAANAVSGLAENAGIFLGPLIAGLLLTRWSPAVVFAVFAGVTFVGGLLVARLHVDPNDVTPTSKMDANQVLRQAFGGFEVLREERHARLLVLVLSTGGVVVGALDVLFVAVAISLLHKGQGWAGFLDSAFGLGGIAGAAAAVSLVGRRRLTPALLGGGSLLGGPIAVLGAAPAPASAPLLLALSGAGRGIASVAGTTLLQRTSDDVVLSRVFGILEGLGMLTLAIGSISAAGLIRIFDTRVALLGVGAFVPLVLAATWIPLVALERQATAPDPKALALLRGLAIFAPLPAPAIERILFHLIHLDVPAGHVLIQEGAAGDRFYVIVEGEAVVTRAGEYVIDRGPGDHVGEIALLRDVPRTATVTAKSDLKLLALDREPFLEAVTGHPQARARAEAIADERM